MITHDELIQVLDYDPKTGVFKRKDAIAARRYGEIAGSVGSHGYVDIRVNGSRCLAHRLAWFFYYGEWPASSIDHVNGDRTDNRIANLREATPSDQMKNKRIQSNNALGLKGVFFRKARRKWVAKIKTSDGQLWLGSFDCPAAAHFAYAIAAERHFGRFARVA